MSNQAIEALRAYVLARNDRDQGVRAMARYAEPVRDWLAANPGEYLYDEGTGLEARLQTAHGADTYDVASMPDAVILAAARWSLLTVDHTVLKALDGKRVEVLDMKKWRQPGGETTRLSVTKKE